MTLVTGFWHTPWLQMTKTELQSALAEATQTDKRTAGVFLDTLGALAYKESKRMANWSCPVSASWYLQTNFANISDRIACPASLLAIVTTRLIRHMRTASLAWQRR
jgi:hypothetical protein